MMFRKRERRKVPILNTTSTADISFMLLIFFLVASSMDLDKGLSRQLPAIDKTKTPPAAVDSRKVMRIVIDAENQVTLDGKAITMKELLQRTTQFIQTNGKGHLIQLQSDRNASYETYLHVQNQLVAAYNTLRNQRSLNLFGKELSYVAMNSRSRLLTKFLCAYQRYMLLARLTIQRKEVWNEILSWQKS